MKIDWLPNWVDEAEYPTAKAPLHEWAWQFLRRNPEYQRMWDAEIRPFYDFSAHAFDSEAAMAAASRKAEEDSEFRRIRDGGLGAYTIKSPEEVLREKFGATMCPPPEMAQPNLKLEPHWVRGRGRPAAKHLAPDRPYPVTLSLDRAEHVIVFDLAWPLASQIERAKRWLEARARYLQGLGELERIRRANHIRKFPTYLRLLDAEAAGATLKEIAEVIYPIETAMHGKKWGTDRVNDDLQAARRLRDRDYRYIAL